MINLKKKILIVIVFIFFLSGCSTNNLEQRSEVDNKSRLESKRDVESTPISSKEEEKEVITDIKNWRHPTKKVFEDWSFEVLKVELLNNKTYPIFYIENKPPWEDNFYKYLFLKDVAEKNGYWNFKLIEDNGNYIEVESDKQNKVLMKSISNKGNVDYTKYDYSSFNGEWYIATVLPNMKVGKIELFFTDDKKSAILSIFDNIMSLEIKKEIKFDFGGIAKFILEKQEWNIELHTQKNGVSALIKNSNGGVVLINNYIRKKDIDNINRCMDITADIVGIKDWRVRDSATEGDFDAVYLNYEGKNEEEKYIIGVRRCRDTVIRCWYYFDPITLEYEIDPEF